MRRMRAGAIDVTVVGTVACVSIVPGTVVDVDQVVGETGGQPMTLEAALGADLLLHFQPVDPAPAVPLSTRRRGRADGLDRGQTAAEE